MARQQVKRLEPSLATIKKLFAYSGKCAIPNCKALLVDETGAMIGKIAHIHAAGKGARSTICFGLWKASRHH